MLFWRFYKFPDRDRVELTKKRDVVYVYRGDKGFEITYKGTRTDDPKAVSDYLRRREYSLDWVIRKWLSQPGIALFYEGHTIAAQKDTEQVTIMTASNQSVTLYIDQQYASAGEEDVLVARSHRSAAQHRGRGLR